MKEETLMKITILVLLGSIIIGCSSGRDSSSPVAKIDNDKPIVELTKDPSSGFNQMILTHSKSDGELSWSLKVQDNDVDQDGECILETQDVGSQNIVSFKDDLQTPFCSSFEIDPISTIDNVNIVINTPNSKLEVCLNDQCQELN